MTDRDRMSNQLSGIWETALASRVHSASYRLSVGQETLVDVAGSKRFSAASMIKTGLLFESLRAVDDGDIDWLGNVGLDESMTAGGDGFLRASPLPCAIRFCDVAAHMIATSDNTAANVVIRELGGLTRSMSLCVPLLNATLCERG